MVGKVAFVTKNRFQRTARDLVFNGAVELGTEIGRGEVHPVICGVSTGGNGGRVRCPHTGRRRHRRENGRIGFGYGFQNLAFIALKAQCTKGGNVRALVGRQNALHIAPVRQPLHFRQPLECRLPGVGHRIDVGF